jgi:hypothetical protein
MAPAGSIDQEVVEDPARGFEPGSPVEADEPGPHDGRFPSAMSRPSPGCQSASRRPRTGGSGRGVRGRPPGTGGWPRRRGAGEADARSDDRPGRGRRPGLGDLRRVPPGGAAPGRSRPGGLVMKTPHRKRARSRLAIVGPPRVHEMGGQRVGGMAVARSGANRRHPGVAAALSQRCPTDSTGLRRDWGVGARPGRVSSGGKTCA